MRRFALLVLSAVCLQAGLAAQARADHTHAQHVEQLGSVQFANSCRAEAQKDFLRGLAFLHSFGYEEARRSFLAAAAADPRCAIAQWGIAMTYYHPIWAPPTPDELAAGADAAAMAAAIPPGTERERAYVDAIGVFYRDAGKLDHKSRALAYEQSMARVAARFPEDHEAAIFHALAILGNSPITDKTFAGQKRAAAILNGLLPLEPEHPGITHYLIHAYDYPQLAELALDGARAYAKIAPDSPHALHMPSHIFTRLGMWDESIASNLESARAARELVGRHHPGAESFDALHALDYLEYAYLQTAQDEKARAVVGEIARVDKLDEPNFAAGYALAAVPARWALERRDWAAAKALTVTPRSVPVGEGALRRGDHALRARRGRGPPEGCRDRAVSPRAAGEDQGRSGAGPGGPLRLGVTDRGTATGRRRLARARGGGRPGGPAQPACCGGPRGCQGQAPGDAGLGATGT